MKKTLIRNCLCMTLALMLPGCMMINAMLGVASFVTTSPLQYAGVAYTVGEYTYEYAVNDKTPDEVIEDKLAWLLPSDSETVPTPASPASVASKDMGEPPTAPRLAHASSRDVSSRPTLRPGTGQGRRGTTLASEQPTLVASADRSFIPRKAVSQAPAQDLAEAGNTSAPSAKPKAAASRTRQRPAKPQHEYIVRPHDPLQDRLARLEQGLPQAERMALRTVENGIRCFATNNDAGQTETGISGSWSIRHSIMQPAPNSLVEAGKGTESHVAS